jgi:hypothetical protein
VSGSPDGAGAAAAASGASAAPPPFLSSEPLTVGGPTLVDRLVVAALAGCTAYAGYELYKLATDWPEPCERMLALVRSDADVAALLGAPVQRAACWWDGTVTPSVVHVRVPLTGPKGSATLFGSAVKGVGRDGSVDEAWTLLSCEVHVHARCGAAPPAPDATTVAFTDAANNPFGEGVSAIVDVLTLKRQITPAEATEPWFVAWLAARRRNSGTQRQ